MPTKYWLAIVLLVTALMYTAPLISSNASIQWDAVDVHYTSQRYLADSLHAGKIPFWTPFIYSGFPFLADPQVGAFYPLNWPFFLAGIGPKSIEAELALHALLAAIGAFLFFRRFVTKPQAALVGAFLYAFSGFFAGHSSHVGMFQAAALAPWLLYLFDCALNGAWLRYTALAGLCGGCMILAGHFQTALYAFAALALFALARVLDNWRRLGKAAGSLVIIALLAVALSAIAVLPGLELTAQSIRAGASYADSQEGALAPGALTTLLFPDAFNAISGKYNGPGDITQYYFYAGLLLLPLVALGLLVKAARWTALLLVLPAVWYMLGPSFGLFRVVAMLPGFGQVRAPVHGWFIAALGLALLAASGAAWINERMKSSLVAFGLLAVVAVDCAWNNSWMNPLAYQRSSFEETYGAGEFVLSSRVKPAVPAGGRFLAPDKIAAFGPMNSPLQVHLETTYGYNPLELRAYSEFRQAAQTNPLLERALAPGLKLNTAAGSLILLDGALGRAWFPKGVNVGEARQKLSTLNPAEEAVVAAPLAGVGQDAQVTGIEDAGLRAKTRANAPSLLVLSIPYYPGWTARINGGAAVPVLRVDHALQGVLVPAGESDVVLKFQSTQFGTGAAASAAALLLTLILTLLPSKAPAARAERGTSGATM